MKGVVVGEGDTYEDALADVKSAIAFHLETFGDDALIAPEDQEFLQRVQDTLEDEADLQQIRERLHDFDETGEAVPWEQIKAERKCRQPNT